MLASLDKDTLSLLIDTAKKTVDVKTQPLPNDPEKLLVIADGKTSILEVPYTAKPRQHTVESIESFAAAYDRWAKDAPEAGIEPQKEDHPGRLPNIWLDLDNWQLQFFTDEPLRRSWVRLKLTPSPQLLLLQKFENCVTLNQKQLVRMLRHDLAGCIDAGVLAAFRSVDFEKMINAKRQIDHGRQSLDSDVVAQVKGDKKPEEISVQAPLFAMRELNSAVTRVSLTVDIDCDSQAFELQAKPGQLDMALDDARAAVLARLQAELAGGDGNEVTILAGSPGA